MPREENIKTVRLAAERFTARDLEGYLELYHGGVLHHGFGNIKRGVGGLREHFQQLLRGFPNLRIDSQDIFGDDEKVAHQYTFYGTHQGEYLGYAPTNNFLIAHGILLHLFERGKCVEIWQVVDNVRFLAAIGAISQLPKLRSDAPSSAGR